MSNGVHLEPQGIEGSEIGAGGTLWFCRHAEVNNPQQLLYGRTPGYGLTAGGMAVADTLGKFVAGQAKLSALYCSPLIRARQTARQIATAQPGLKITYSRQLLEVHTSYDGVPMAQIGDFNFYEPPAHPEDETIEQVRDRVLGFFANVVNRWKGRQIAAVSHGDPVVIMHAVYLGLPMQLSSLRKPNFYPERASVTRYDFPPEGFSLNPQRVRVSYFEPPYNINTEV